MAAAYPCCSDRGETNQGWLGIGPAVGAALNGAAMGAGFVTRIGYWLWYVIPVTCFLLASPRAGALVFGLYGLVRAAFPVALAVNDRLRERDADDRHLHKLQDAMTTHVRPAATLCTHPPRRCIVRISRILTKGR